MPLLRNALHHFFQSDRHHFAKCIGMTSEYSLVHRRILDVNATDTANDGRLPGSASRNDVLDAAARFL